MSSKTDPSTSNEPDSKISPLEEDSSGKRLRLNKQTVQDLSPTGEHADKMRGSAKPCTAGLSGCADT